MPKMSCTSKGKKGIKYGNTGKCYTGANKESKMRKQMAAINISKTKRAGHKIRKNK